MKKTFLSALLIGASCLWLSAQSGRFETFQITPEEGPVRVSQLEVLGVDNLGKPNNLYFKFVHPGGGVQQVLGIATGGDVPTDIPAFGTVNLSSDGKPTQANLQWVAPSGNTTKIHLLADPVGGLRRKEFLARKGEVMRSDSLRILENSVKRPEAEVPMAETYYETQIKVGFGGDINSITTQTYTLAPEPKSVLGALMSINASPYKSRGVSYGKKTLEGVLNDGTPEAKVEYASSQTRHDPVTGNAFVVGGIEYKKDKTKENSEYYEFRFVTFDKEANVVANILYKSEEPLVLERVTNFGGKTIAPGVREVTHVGVVARGGGSKKMTGVDTKLLKIFVVNIKTGQIVHEGRMVLDRADAKLVSANPLPNGEIEVLYHYAQGTENGFQVLNISPAGVAYNKTFAHDGPEAKSMKFNLARTNGAAAELVMQAARPEGGTRLLKHFTIKRPATQDKPASEENLGAAFFDYDAQGHLVSFRSAPDELSKLSSLNLLTATSTQYVFFGVTNPTGKTPKMSFLTMDVATEAVSTQQSPNGQSLVSAEAYYLDRATKSVYFFTKTDITSGFFVHRFIP